MGQFGFFYSDKWEENLEGVSDVLPEITHHAFNTERIELVGRFGTPV